MRPFGLLYFDTACPQVHDYGGRFCSFSCLDAGSLYIPSNAFALNCVWSVLFCCDARGIGRDVARSGRHVSISRVPLPPEAACAHVCVHVCVCVTHTPISARRSWFPFCISSVTALHGCPPTHLARSEDDPFKHTRGHVHTDPSLSMLNSRPGSLPQGTGVSVRPSPRLSGRARGLSLTAGASARPRFPSRSHLLLSVSGWRHRPDGCVAVTQSRSFLQ